MSRVLNGHPSVSSATRQRVLRSIRELGYQPNAMARGLASRSTGMVGLIVPDIANEFYASLFSGLEETMAAHGYRVLLSHARAEEEILRSTVGSLASGHVDAVLMTAGTLTGSHDIVEGLIQSGVPTVVLGRPRGPMLKGVDYVSIDNEQAAYDITAHLLGQGYRDIAIVAGIAPADAGYDRLEGFRRAMQDADREVSPHRVHTGEFTLRDGAQAAERWSRQQALPDAIFAANDMMAVGAMLWLQGRGVSIPEDVAIAGFDGIAMSEIVSPRLTTVHQPADEMGRRAGHLLIQRLQGWDEPPQHVMVPYRLVVRASSVRTALSAASRVPERKGSATRQSTSSPAASCEREQ